MSQNAEARRIVQLELAMPDNFVSVVELKMFNVSTLDVREIHVVW